MDLISILKETMSREGQGEKTALVLFQEDNLTQISYSWKEYFDKAKNVALALHCLNLIRHAEENFFVILPLNLPESFFVMLGVILAGGVPVPLNVPLVLEPDKNHLKKIIRHCRPAAVLASEELRPHLTDISHLGLNWLLEIGEAMKGEKNLPATFQASLNQQKKEEDLLIVPYTSGTSQKEEDPPKGVMLSHKNILDRVVAVSEILEITAEERVISYLSLGHISDLIATFFGQIINGYTVYFTSHIKDLSRESLKINFPAVLRAVQPTMFVAVPKVWINLRVSIEKKTKKGLVRLLPYSWLEKPIKKELGFGQTRHFFSAAALLLSSEADFFRKIGIGIKDIYGQTETAGPLLMDGEKIGPLNEVFLDPQSKEILVCGPAVMSGYYQNLKANRQALKIYPPKKESVLSTEQDPEENPALLEYHWPSPLPSRSGQWCLHTGDRGRYDENSKLLYASRMGRGFKLAQGEYVTDETVEELEQKIKSALSELDPQAEAIVCGDGKAYIVALIFIKNAPLTVEKLDELKYQLEPKIFPLGERLHRIKNFAILDSSRDLMQTPTLKPRPGAIIKKFQEIIDQL